STTPENKKYILEEFTGINCPNCPGGHTTAANILAAHPGDAFVVAYHPTNSSYTTPSSGQPDFRRSFADAFYSLSYLGGSSRFMPSAMNNRRTVGGTKIQSTNAWASNGNTILSESSPVNVGLEAIYDSNKDSIEIRVEVYFTSSVTNAHTINVVMSENNIIGYQSGSGGSATYNHEHVFREAFTSQWGDAISNTSQGDLTKFKFYFPAASTAGYDLSNLDVLAFVYDSDGQEVMTGNGTHVIDGVITSVADDLQAELDLTVAPNPFSGSTQIFFNLDNAAPVAVSMLDLMGKKVYSAPAMTGKAGQNVINVDAAGLSSGVYLLQMDVNGQKTSRKVILD
ncbi:MAG: Omp28-related outer membrane protein, partial [Bdellovibrionales bacterium]|nr:Omp28-related outer membrane protein [Bdellovibrionales bacterium]